VLLKREGEKQEEKRKAFGVDLPGISGINYSFTAIFNSHSI